MSGQAGGQAFIRQTRKPSNYKINLKTVGFFAIPYNELAGLSKASYGLQF